MLELPDANFTHFDTFVEQQPGSSSLRLTVSPENLVFDPMPARAGQHLCGGGEEREREAVAEMLA